MLEVVLHQLELGFCNQEFFEINFFTVYFVKYLPLFILKLLKVSHHSFKIHCLLLYKLDQNFVDIGLSCLWEVINYFPSLLSVLTVTPDFLLVFLNDFLYPVFDLDPKLLTHFSN